MNVSTLYGNPNSMYGITSDNTASNVGSVNTSSASRRSSVPPAGAAGTTSISSGGNLFRQLQQLEQQNPTEFKAVAAQLATSFQAAAAKATGPEAAFLGKLSDQFSQAAQTGTLQLPQQATDPNAVAAQVSATGATASSATTQSSQSGGGAHHHHHHHGGGGVSQSSDVQQAFQDGLSILAQATQASSASGTSSG